MIGRDNPPNLMIVNEFQNGTNLVPSSYYFGSASAISWLNEEAATVETLQSTFSTSLQPFLPQKRRQ